jgi:CheY-specific phosphatase CheX
MQPIAHQLDVRQFMVRHFTEVCSTMLSIEAGPLPDPELPHFASRVTGSVGFGGETVTGVVYLHLSAAFAKTAASAMLGLGAEEDVSEPEQNDVIGEVTNMLAGGLKSALCDAGAACAVSTPSIIRGTAFVIEPTPGLDRIILVFDCGAEPVGVEIHMHYT